MDLEAALITVNAAPLLGASVLLSVIWWHGRRERYALSWALAFALALLVMVLVRVARPPFTLSTGALALLADTLFNGIFLLFLHGAALYAGRRSWMGRWLLALTALTALIGVTLARNDLILREVLNGGFIQAALMATLYHLWGVRPRGLADWVLMGAFGIAALANGVFVIDVMVNRPLDAFDPSTLGSQVSWLVQPFIVSAVAAGGVAATLLRLLRQHAAERQAAQHVAEQARAADRAKSEFLATISHEIRTPINAIQGCLQILETHNLNAAQVRLLEVMGSASGSLLALIDDVLDMARLEAGRLEVASGPVDLGLLLGELMAVIGPRAERKGLVLSLRTGDGVPSGVVTDAKRLRQILMCLLDNAVKFTERGHITLAVDRVNAPGDQQASTGEGAHWVRFQVIDTGIGIPPEKLDRIFEVFSQADNSISRRFGGAGLGLAIARSLTDMLGGVLTVDSGPEQGSQFTLCLPLSPLAVQREGDEAHIARDALRQNGLEGKPVILLVEDDAVNRQAATELLEIRGAQVVQATNGIDALSILETRPVDAVIMDLSMPEMDGLEAARRARNLPGRAGRVPIVALTTNLSADIRRQCREAGMQAFLTKPVKLNQLIDTLTSVLPLARPAA